MDDAQLYTVWQQRQFRDRTAPISAAVSALMKHDLEKRVRQLCKLATIWDEIIPDDIRDHTALESFQRGVLTVQVDSSPHRFRLEMLLAGGLLAELRKRFSGPIQRVRLQPGQFYSVDVSGEHRYEL
jgi:hypothetical protein